MISQIVAGFMLAEGIVSGAAAYVLFLKKRSKLERSVRTWGVVIEVKEESGSEGPTKHPVIQYKSPSGDTATFESKYGSSNWRVKPGDRLEILVCPDDPASAEVVSFMAQWGLPLIFAIVSAMSLIGAPILFQVLKP